MNEIFITETNFRNRYRYTPDDLLGEGGFAQVYKAYDQQFEEYVALKFYNKGDQGKYDVLHEMKDSRKFSHPNIIRIHDAFIVRFEHAGGYSFVQVGVLEFANGGNLRDFIKSSPSEDEFKKVLIGILGALSYLHQDKNLIHRDLSPENILMYVDTDGWIPKIADFGISKKVNLGADNIEAVKSTQLLGKVDYMAPEQFYPEKYGLHGKINTQVDLWAFGVIMYELFTHRKPFGDVGSDNPIKIIHSIENNKLKNFDQIPEPYQSIILGCLQKNVLMRIKSADSIIAMLRKGAETIGEKKKTRSISDFTQSRRKPMLIVAILVFFTLFVAGVFIIKRFRSEADIEKLPDYQSMYLNIKSDLENRKLKDAKNKMALLPDSIKHKNRFSELYKQILHQQENDSLYTLATLQYKEKNYQIASANYRLLVNRKSTYDSISSIQLKQIQIIEDSIRAARDKKKMKELKKSRSAVYKKGDFTIENSPIQSLVDLVSIKLTDKETIVSLLIYPSENSYYIEAPGSPGAFFLEYNGKKQLPLVNIQGIETGELDGIREKTMVDLYFALLPAGVKKFNLIESREPTADGFIRYWNFVGISLP